MKTAISVIICTHNPRRDYLSLVLERLKAQTLNLTQWEVLLIDNASSQQLASEFDLSWHPNSRHIREDQLGLTSARLRGIQEAQSALLIFVDDDNALNIDYLTNALEISDSHPTLGAWGGQTLPEFEQIPPAWTEEYWSYIGIRKFEQNYCSKMPLWEATPIGAGLCIRKQVADAYATLVRNDSKRLGLDRRGNLLTGCGDLDMVYTAHDLNLYTGLFINLKLQHLIPSKRLEEQYLLQIYEGNAYSATILSFLRGQIKLPPDLRTRLKLKLPWLKRPAYFFQSNRQKKFGEAEARGRVNALKEVLELSA
jgi:hypothetical protein